MKRVCGKRTSLACIGSMNGKWITTIAVGSQAEAAEYFIDHKRNDVTLGRVELVGPDDPGVREYAHSPIRRLLRGERAAGWTRMKPLDKARNEGHVATSEVSQT